MILESVVQFKMWTSNYSSVGAVKMLFLQWTDKRSSQRYLTWEFKGLFVWLRKDLFVEIESFDKFALELFQITGEYRWWAYNG